MSSWAVQLLTLVAVALGAFASYTSTRMIDRSRWQREEALRWDVKRPEAYSDFASALVTFGNIAWRISAAHGLAAGVHLLDPEVGLLDLAAAESEANVQWQKILLLGSPDVIAAAHKWREEAWHLEWFARRLRSDSKELTKATRDRREARKRFYSVARVDLGVITGNLPAEVDPVASAWWRQVGTKLPNVLPRRSRLSTLRWHLAAYACESHPEPGRLEGLVGTATAPGTFRPRTSRRAR